MKSKFLVFALLLAMLPVMADAQTSKEEKKADRARMKNKTPDWGAAHSYQNDKYVYFPDYYTFYSPNRGYIYWNNNSWTNSRSIPSNMSAVDMNKARLQTLDVPLNTFPEKSLSNYSTQYPAQPVNGVTTPMPQVK